MTTSKPLEPPLNLPLHFSSIYGQQKIPETPTSERVPIYMYYSDVPENITVPANSEPQVWKHLYLVSVSPFEEEGRVCFEEGIIICLVQTCFNSKPASMRGGSRISERGVQIRQEGVCFQHNI